MRAMDSGLRSFCKGARAKDAREKVCAFCAFRTLAHCLARFVNASFCILALECSERFVEAHDLNPDLIIRQKDRNDGVHKSVRTLC